VSDDRGPRGDLAGALHDVSNALTVLLGWLAEARALHADTAAAAHALAMVDDRARAARDLARRAIGVDVPRDEEADLADDVLARTVAALSLEAQRAHVVLSLEGAAPGVRASAPTDLAQVVTNLVLNAIAHSPRGGSVTVTIEAPLTSALTIDVVDEGPGVSEDRRVSIFEGDSRRPGGAGVGLRHARALARAMGGDLALVPTEPPPSEPCAPRAGAIGAFFRLTWPRVGVAASVPPSATRGAALAGLRVLLIEDDFDVTLLLETALGARGAEVVVARDAAALARAMAVPRRHDVALVDLSPIADDFPGAVARLREHSPGVAIVFITGSADATPAAAGALDAAWVRKPFEVSEVVAAVADARRNRP